MKTDRPTLNWQPNDRYLNSADSAQANARIAARTLRSASNGDRVPEFFNSAIQMLLAGLLLSSLAIFGFNVTPGVSQTRSKPGAVAIDQARQTPAPGRKIAQAESPAASTYRMQTPTISHTLKMSPKFFLLD